MSLPLVQSKRESIALNAETLNALMETAAGTVDAAEYFVSQYKERLGRNPSPALIEKLDEWKTLVVAGLTESATKWDGEFVERSQLSNSLMHLSDEAIKDSQVSATENLHLDYAISANANFVRAWSSNNEAVSEKVQDALDLSLNAWFTEQNMLIESGILYQIGAEGRRTIVDPVLMQQLIQDDLRGLKAYLHKKEIELSIERQQYPEQKEATPSVQ